ncbi:hypothetical protein M3J09_008762 [Ascochyta lentis]
MGSSLPPYFSTDRDAQYRPRVYQNSPPVPHSHTARVTSHHYPPSGSASSPPSQTLVPAHCHLQFLSKHGNEGRRKLAIRIGCLDEPNARRQSGASPSTTRRSRACES